MPADSSGDVSADMPARIDNSCLFRQSFTVKLYRIALLYSFAEITLSYSLLIILVQLALSIEFHLFAILIRSLLMGFKVNLSMPYHTEHQMIFCSHISTSTDKLYILANNSQIKGLYNQR